MLPTPTAVFRLRKALEPDSSLDMVEPPSGTCWGFERCCCCCSGILLAQNVGQAGLEMRSIDPYPASLVMVSSAAEIGYQDSLGDRYVYIHLPAAALLHVTLEGLRLQTRVVTGIDVGGLEASAI